MMNASCVQKFPARSVQDAKLAVFSSADGKAGCSTFTLTHNRANWLMIELVKRFF